MKEYGYPIKIVHTCGHTEKLYRSINEPSIREWAERQELKTCGCIQCNKAQTENRVGGKENEKIHRWLTR